MQAIREAYELLGLKPGASASDVRKARRSLAKIHHPDRFAGDSKLQAAAEKQMKAINAATELLLDHLASEGQEASSGEPTTVDEGVTYYEYIMSLLIVEEQMWRELRARTGRSAAWGVVIALGGLAVSWGALTGAGNGGAVFYGAIIYGGWRVFRILPSYLTSRREHARAEARVHSFEKAWRDGTYAAWDPDTAVPDVAPIPGNIKGMVAVIIMLCMAIAAVMLAEGPSQSSTASVNYTPPAQPSVTSVPYVPPAPQTQASAPSQTFPLAFGDPYATIPEWGSADRVAIMDASRDYLNTSTEFYVHRIYVKGNLAVADIEPYPEGSGKRVKLAYERGSSGWTVAGQFQDSGTPASAPSSSQYTADAWTPLYTADAYTPEPGSSERQALMDASRAYLHLSTQFYVHSLRVSGNRAVGDIEPYPKGTGNRVELAFERLGGSWQVVAQR